MSNKIFVSYKYADTNVKKVNNNKPWYINDTVRDYVDIVEEVLKNKKHVYKGEHNNEDLSYYSENYIWNELKDRIYDSTVTIVMISPNMKNAYQRDKNQWIPWEISYSLKEMSRKDINGNSKISRANGILAVVIPDQNGNYDFFIKENYDGNGTTLYKTNMLFHILEKNMFNKKEPIVKNINGINIYYGDSSYVEVVKWDDFIKKPEIYIDIAKKKSENIDEYNICKEI